MDSTYIRGKSWVELMEEEKESDGELENGIENGMSESEEIRMKAPEALQAEKDLACEERLLAGKETVADERELKNTKQRLEEVEESNQSEWQIVNDEDIFNLSDCPKTDLKEKPEVSDIKIKTETLYPSSCDARMHNESGSNISKANCISVKNFIPEEKIKKEPKTQGADNEHYSALDIKPVANVNKIKVKNEVEEIDDDDRISQELEVIERNLSHTQHKDLNSLDDSVTIHDSEGNTNNHIETDTFIHPENVINGDHKPSDGNPIPVVSSTQTSPRKNRSARKRKGSSNIGSNRRKYSCRDPSASSSSSGSCPSSNTTTPRKEKKRVEYERDPEVLARRQKQIDYGKNTIGYDRYRQQVPKEKRSNRDPRTPPKHIKYSRRAWDGMVKIWRQKLHGWDPVTDDNADDKQTITAPELSVSVDVSSAPYKRRIHTSTVSSVSGSGSTDDVGTDDFISLDYDDLEVE